MKKEKKLKKIKPIKAYAIVSDMGFQYDANGNSLSLAIYSKIDEIRERRKRMISEDRIIPVLISPLPKKKSK